MEEYLQEKVVAENPYTYHELDVRDARAFIRGYETALRQPPVIGSFCTCTKFRETPMINDKHICSICNKPILQTDL